MSFSLNPNQKKAAEEVDSPLLIIAGAGTGKTKVITSKIEFLINQKKISPDKILALTFTEKAQQEMVERTDNVLAINYSNVNIKTFHGFCDQILREYGHNIGIDGAFKLMTGLESWVYLKKNLFKFHLNYFRPSGDPIKFINDLLGYFDRLKDEDIKPEDFLKYFDELETKTEEEREHKEKMLELGKLYKDFQEMKVYNNKFSFSDLQYYVHRIIEERPSCLKELRERFEYIMVDEFQDTNFSQNKLVKLIVGGRKCLTVVGDDDQAIYKWRGASLSNILSFEETYPNYKKVVLNTNYRSNQNILDLAYKSIQNNNPDRLEIKENINKSLCAFKTGKESINTYNFGNYQYEIDFIVKEIIKLNKEKNLKLGEIAILLRSNAFIPIIAKALEKNGIKAKLHTKLNLLKSPVCKDLIALLKFLANPTDSIALYRVLTNPFFNINHEFILKHLNDGKKFNTSMFSYLKQKMKKPDTQIDMFAVQDDSWHETINMLSELLEYSKRKSLSEVLSYFLHDKGFLKYLLKDENKYEDVLIVSEFSEKIYNFEEQNLFTNIYSFIENLSHIEDFMFYEGENMDFEDSQNSVHLMTIHASKGLEFEAVFIPMLVKNKFPVINRKEVFEIPESLIPENLSQENTHIEEERRLFYVALTRSKTYLYLSYSLNYGSKRVWKPSPFLSELFGSGLLQENEYIEDEEINYLDTPKENNEKSEVPAISKRMSYSKLNTYLMCPLKYKFNYIYKIPTPPSFSASFGLSIHNTLNKFYIDLMADKEVSLELMLEYYKTCWINMGYMSEAHLNKQKKKGEELLIEYYKINSKPWILPDSIEKPFQINIANKIFSGRIDRIDKMPDGSYEIIDYKTGKTKEAKALKKDFQLLIYLLVLEKQFKVPVSKLSLYFMGENKKVSIDASEVDMDKLLITLEENLKKLDSGDFTEKPGMMCKYCDYRLICDKW